MSDKYGKLHGIDCDCDFCRRIDAEWRTVERVLAEARSRRRGLRDQGPRPRSDSRPPADPDAASGAPGDDGGDEG